MLQEGVLSLWRERLRELSAKKGYEQPSAFEGEGVEGVSCWAGGVRRSRSAGAVGDDESGQR
jgi:hypothetical protein